MYIQIILILTFVSTNLIYISNMKIEELIQSTITLGSAKRVLLNIMFAQNKISDKFNEILKPLDLSPEQYNVLRILRGQKGKPANMSCIQERMIAKMSNTTRLIDKLLVKEFVSRKICPENKRKMEITITQKGLDILTLLDPKVIEHENYFAQKLSSEELETLNNLLEKYRS